MFTSLVLVFSSIWSVAAMPRSLQELRQLSIDEYLLDCKPFATLSSDERIFYPDIAGSLRCLGLERVDDEVTAEVKKRYKKLALV